MYNELAFWIIWFSLGLIGGAIVIPIDKWKSNRSIRAAVRRRHSRP